MCRMGLTLSKEDLYSINKSSLKDAIVQFGGGCTAEMISANGLLITNHHCGYGNIAALSTVEHNYLDNGFWSKNMAEELPADGLSVIYLQQIVDVTDELNAGLRKLSGAKAEAKKKELIEAMEKRASEGDKYEANVKEYFNGNQYLLLTYKRYKDVRLVATPPKSLGKYGGDTDNWIWPRHTADFSMFRVYANASNEPAAYSASNVPYRPKRYLPVNIGGVKEGDYAMIFGYPGRTNRYEVSYGVENSINEVNPSIVKARTLRLDVMDKHMDADKEVYLKLTSGRASISNYWKYFIGQTEQLKRNNVVARKQASETEFLDWARKNKKKEYLPLMNDYAAIYKDYTPVAKHSAYYSEAFRSNAIARMGASLEPLEKALLKGPLAKDTLDKYVKFITSVRKANIKGMDRGTDVDLLGAMTELYYREVPKSQLPDIYTRVIFKKFGSENNPKTFTDYAKYVADNTFLLDDEKFKAFTDNPTLTALYDDPGAEYGLSFVHNWNDNYQPIIEKFAERKKEYSKLYMRGLMEMNSDRSFYPDANSTMRISYGQVKGYSPKDAVTFDYFTTLDGFMEKYKPGDDEFDAPKELIELYKNRDYGRYANQDSTLVTCFITTNDITGGNSGSPIMNGAGHFIGIAFDGNWEAMSGDIAFDKQYKRTIATDARFILFLIEKLGKAQNLIEEMDIRY